MTYEVRWTEKSVEQLKGLDKLVAKRIVEKMCVVSRNPFAYVEKLKNFNLFKLRVGDYRAILAIESGKMIIFVLEVGHRSSIYRNY